jgi:hypothetical protein
LIAEGIKDLEAARRGKIRESKIGTTINDVLSDGWSTITEILLDKQPITQEEQVQKETNENRK